MPTYNKDIADIFNKVADLLEIEGANPFRVRAYRVKALYDWLCIGDPESLKAAAESGRVQEIEGFGATLEENILEEMRKKH